jgi:hypothetical protein
VPAPRGVLCVLCVLCVRAREAVDFRQIEIGKRTTRPSQLQLLSWPPGNKAAALNRCDAHGS